MVDFTISWTLSLGTDKVLYTFKVASCGARSYKKRRNELRDYERTISLKGSYFEKWYDIIVNLRIKRTS